MPQRPDLRDLVTSVREAFADADRDTLLDVLAFVVQEYVAEGPPPMLMHQAEKLSDLANLSFAQLVSTLQTRLELPELSLFAVDGEQVSVRVGGVMQPLSLARAGGAPAAELPRPAAGVHVVETPTLPRPASAPPVQIPGSGPTVGAPRPVQGLSLRGRPSGEGAPAAAPAAAPAPAPAAAAPAPAAGPAPAASPDKPKDGGDDASARFSLLELD